MTLESDPGLKGGEARLWRLIEERTQAGADTARIDERIWDLFGEEWTVVCTDLSGFSRHAAAFGIIHFLQIIHEQKKLLLPIVARHDGVLVKAEADNLLLLFKRPSVALACTIAMQHACQQLSARRVEAERVVLCAGMGFGKILRVGESDVYGAEVNAASKLGEDVAQGHEILVTGAVRGAIGERDDVAFDPIDVDVPGAERAFRVRYARH
jgi:adenylate cyclase